MKNINRIYSNPRAVLAYVIILTVCVIYMLSVFVFHVSESTRAEGDSVKSTYKPWIVSIDAIRLDSDNNLYLHSEGYIICYNNNGNFLCSYNIKSPGATGFFIDEQDNIIVFYYRGGYVRTYNRDGMFLSENNNPSDALVSEFDESTRVCKNGNNTYRLKNFLGYSMVTRDDTTFYKMPVHLLLVKLAIIVSFIMYMLILSYFSTRFIKEITQKTVKVD